jgi:hypothetical protein
VARHRLRDARIVVRRVPPARPAYSGGPKGLQYAQFTMAVNDAVLAVKLSAEFQGDFAAVPRPDSDLPASFHIPEWLQLVILFGTMFFIILLVLVLVATSHMHH